jgi:hypothetical protein
LRHPPLFDRVRTSYNPPVVKTLELAIAKAVALSEAAQEQLGRQLLESIDTLAKLRTEIEIGTGELNAGEGEPLDEGVISTKAR